MIYTVFQILLLLLIAFLLGLLVGWLLFKKKVVTTVDVSSKRRIEELEGSLADERERNAQLVSSQARLGDMEASLKAETERADQNAEAGARLAGLETELRAARAKADPNPGLQARVSQLETDLQAAKAAGGADLDGSKARIAALEADLLTARSATAESAGMKARIAGLEADLATCRARTASLEAGMASTDVDDAAAMQGFVSAATEPDDLLEIVGVGPVLNRFLNDLGITTFRQIAVMTDSEVDGVDAKMEHFKGRIRDEDWVGQARNLHRAKYGSDPHR